jgi:predicted porin
MIEVGTAARRARAMATVTLMAVPIAIPVAASAQSSVTLYGTLDESVEYLTHASNTSHSTVKAGSSEIYGNSFGVTGTEDLGGGIKAIFKLEAGFNPDTGTLLQGGRMFGRSAWLGLRDDNNKLIAGRVYTPLYDVLGYLDPLQGGNISLWSMDGGFVSRVDNGLRYTRTDGPFHENLVYSLGNDGADTPINSVAGAGGRSKEVAASIDYTTKALMAAVIYDDAHGPLQASQYGLGLYVPSTAPVAPATGDRARRIALAARYTFSKTSLFAGYRHLRTVASAQVENANLYWGGVTQQLSPAWSVTLGAYHESVVAVDARPTLLALQTQYLLAKTTGLYANVGKVWNTARSDMGVDTQTQTLTGYGQFGGSIGLFHFF